MNDHRTGCDQDQLRRYLRRVAFAGAPTADAATLTALQAAHLRAIPFENLEIHLGRPMRIGPQELFEDLVDRRRGGYCFQMNELFARVLLAIGFRVERFAARVLLRNPMPQPPRSHQVLRVSDAGGGVWFVDVGFGGPGPLYPVPWELDRVDDQPLNSYRLLSDPERGVTLQVRDRGAADWAGMVSFTLDEQWPIDFKYSNHAISTMPDSRFVLHRIVARAEPELRQTLFDGLLRETRPGGATERQLDGAEEERVLRDVFGLDLPRPLVFAHRQPSV